MATFKDKKGRQWKVDLDAVLIEDVRDTFKINLVDLDKDPMGALRSNPVDLILVTYLLCEEQAKDQGIDQREFMRSAPSPPDPMLDALEEAIVNFFPTGQASHVREVLAKYAEMSDKSRQMIIAKINRAIADPRVTEAMERRADQVFDQELATILQNSGRGTPRSEGSESSTSSTISTE